MSNANPKKVFVLGKKGNTLHIKEELSDPKESQTPCQDQKLTIYVYSISMNQQNVGVQISSLIIVEDTLTMST